MKQKIYALIITTLIPFVVIFFLYKSSKVTLDIAFERSYSAAKLVRTGAIDHNLGDPYNLRKAGSDFYIYDFTERQIERLSPEGKMIASYPSKCNTENFELILGYSVDSSKLIALDLRKKNIIKINLNDCTVEKDTLKLLFRGVPLNDTSLLCMIIDTVHYDLKLLTRNTKTNADRLIPTPLKQYNDGGFGNDGKFSNSCNPTKICYTLYHLGKFYSIDCATGSVTEHSTIDNYSTPPKVVSNGSNFTLSRKSVTVNRVAANNNKYLFIVSNIKTRTDKANSLKCDIIDIYSIETGNYINSVKIEGTENNHIIDLYAEDNSLTLLTKSKLLIYGIN